MRWFFLISLAVAIDTINHPDINYNLIGNISLFGLFSSLSFYNYINASRLLNSPNTVFLLSDNSSIPLFSLGSEDLEVSIVPRDVSFFDEELFLSSRELNSLDSVLLTPLTSTTFLVLGDNSTLPTPFIYNVTDSSMETIPINGSVVTALVDSELIYLGGDFSVNNSISAITYNQTSKELINLPFNGFNNNSYINTIQKVDESIIFGGKFNNLGVSQLLSFNSSSNETDLIFPEQKISLKYGTFSEVNLDSSNPSSITCPGDSVWSVLSDQGGEWTVELPSQMKGLTPTKARIYIPDSENSVKLFRLYSFPNNGIMNLSYINPNSNEIEFCDAWCPLLSSQDLKSANDNYSSNSTFQSFDNSSIRTLGFGEDFQEFAFVNEVGIDKIGLTVLEWYGENGALSGFELFTDSIETYSNNTLNEPNCQDSSNVLNQLQGNWNSILNLDSSINDDYLYSSDSNAKMILYPDISYSGIYSMIITTPGCIPDNTCDTRSIVNVTVVDENENILSTELIYQNNNYDKFDYLFYGRINGSDSTNNNDRIRVEISHVGPINPDTENSITVVDKVISNIVELDESNTLANSSRSDVFNMKLNGLFEYSLNNFTNFNQSRVFYMEGNRTILNPENDYIGNSSINFLSGSLNSDSITDQIRSVQDSGDDRLLILGSFNTNNDITLSNNNLITLNVTSYNSTSNETITEILKRDLFSFNERAEESTLFGAQFSDRINGVFEYDSQTIFLGDFTVLGVDGTELRDLSNGNSTIDSIENIAIYSDQQWYGLGNNDSIVFTQFTNVTIDDTVLFVFSTESEFRTWDYLNSSWVTDPRYDLKINQAVNLNEAQQILGGESFKVMDYYGKDQAFIKDGGFDSYDFEVVGERSGIETAFYINDTVSVLGGNFNTSSGISEIAFLHDGTLSPLSDDIVWDGSNLIHKLYSGSDQKLLVIGMNGSVSINGNDYSGVIIYNLAENRFELIQPPRLSRDDGTSVAVDAIVQYDDGATLLVGGNFDKAGSLDCQGLCTYDLNNTRWNNPSVNSTGNSVSGTASDIRFFSTSQVLISGNLTFNNQPVNFVEYDFSGGEFNSQADLNTLGADKKVTTFIIQEASIKSRVIALGDDFISGFDGKKWASIDEEIVFDSETRFTDIKLLDLAKSNNANKENYFNKNQILMLAGRYELSNYGLVNVALFNGTNWIPYIYSVDFNNEIGRINAILINDRYNFLSPQSISRRSVMAKGKVVGISIACALGSTTLLGLLYLIPFITLFRKRLDGNQYQHERIDQKDQMAAVSPEELFSEMDHQRNH